jgi:hypothetical protein
MMSQKPPNAKVTGVHIHESDCKYVPDRISIQVKGLWPRF